MGAAPSRFPAPSGERQGARGLPRVCSPDCLPRLPPGAWWAQLAPHLVTACIRSPTYSSIGLFGRADVALEVTGSYRGTHGLILWAGALLCGSQGTRGQPGKEKHLFLLQQSNLRANGGIRLQNSLEQHGLSHPELLPTCFSSDQSYNHYKDHCRQKRLFSRVIRRRDKKKD